MNKEFKHNEEDEIHVERKAICNTVKKRIAIHFNEEGSFNQ